MTCVHCPDWIGAETAGTVDLDHGTIDVCSHHLREYREKGYDVAVDDDQVAEDDLNRIRALEGAVENTIGTIRGEAGELEARDDVDDHLRDVIEGLEQRADSLEDTLDVVETNEDGAKPNP